MRDNKRKREDEPYYTQTANEILGYLSQPALSSQNTETQVIEQSPAYNQSVVLNQSVIQNQQLVYQLQRTTDAQQNLVYLIVPANENIRIQSLPFTVINEEQNVTIPQNVESTQLENQTNLKTEGTIILQDVKEEIAVIRSEYCSENETCSDQEKTLEFPQNTEDSTNNTYISSYFTTVSSKGTNNSNKDKSRPHWYRCDYKDCAESFYSLYEKKQHLDTHIFPENSEFKCSICNMVFDKATDRNKHVETHAVPPTFKCKQCQKDFAYFTVLIRHLDEKKCSNKNPITCFFCGSKITDHDELIRHNNLNMRQCSCGTKICGTQAYELHLSVCRFNKCNNKPENPYEKKRLKAKKP